MCVCLLPPANEVWGTVIFLHLSVIRFMGGVPGQVHPLGGYTPSGRCTPSRYTPQQVHSHPLGRYPLGRYTPLGTHTPLGRYTPRSSACWEIRATRGRYASYWNAFLFLYIFSTNRTIHHQKIHRRVRPNFR